MGFLPENAEGEAADYLLSWRRRRMPCCVLGAVFCSSTAVCLHSRAVPVTGIRCRRDPLPTVLMPGANWWRQVLEEGGRREAAMVSLPADRAAPASCLAAGVLLLHSSTTFCPGRLWQVAVRPTCLYLQEDLPVLCIRKSIWVTISTYVRLVPGSWL